ncbi:MAG: hypothetical protein GX558_08880 [Clostridiales bacterium]|nr:hypothetical protein [Clostridiales bacterium]
MLTQSDMRVLRDLAAQLAEVAALPAQAERRAMWRALNRLNMQRPMVMIDQMPWNELAVDDSLTCRVADGYWRSVERDMRQTLYKWRHLPVDMVVNPYLSLPRPIHNTGWGIDIARETLSLSEGDTAPSQHFDNQIQGMEDVERIQNPIITLDEAREREIIQTAEVLFAGILPFRMTGVCMHLGVWDTISQWMGVTDCYIEIMDRPEMIHAMMEKLTRGLISQIEQMNALKLFDVNSHLCHCSHTFGDEPWEDDAEPVSGRAWAFGLAQLFTSVAPEVTDEFEVQYMKRVFPHFHAIYYGCCDRLDDRMEVIAQLPKIRKLSCSPWSDREHFAQTMPDWCVMSNKPTPALLAGSRMDEDQVRADLRRTIKAARAYNRPLEMILKDISTVSRDPARLWRWAEIAMEEVNNA